MLVSGFTNMWGVPGVLTCTFCFAEVCFASTFCFPSPPSQVSTIGKYNFHSTFSAVLMGAWRWSVARLPWRPLYCWGDCCPPRLLPIRHLPSILQLAYKSLSSSNFWECGRNPMVWPFKWNLFASIGFAEFEKMKFGIFLEFLLWPLLGVKGLRNENTIIRKFPLLRMIHRQVVACFHTPWDDKVRTCNHQLSGKQATCSLWSRDTLIMVIMYEARFKPDLTKNLITWYFIVLTIN